MAQRVKNLPAKRETQVQSLGGEDPLEKGMATHYSCLEKFHEKRSLVGYSPWDCKESDTTERLTLRAPALVNQAKDNGHQKSETRVSVCKRALR